jgi:hypothetical protein
MQMLEWLTKNHMSISEVARHFGVAPITLHRNVTGARWPSAEIMVSCYRLTNRQVDLVDWIETCRDLLLEAGVIQPGDQYGGPKESNGDAEAGAGGGEGHEHAGDGPQSVGDAEA